MTDLFFFAGTALDVRVETDQGLTKPVPLPIRRALARDPIPEGMPFFVDLAGIQPIAQLNDFLRELPVQGCPQPLTWKACARHLHAIIQFLEAEYGSTSLLDLTHEHLARFHRLRRIVGTRTIVPDTWNQCLLWIEKLFRWLLQRGHVAALPFQPPSRLETAVPASGGGRSPMRERTAASTRIRCTSVEEFLFFRDVGLGGLLSIGGPLDPEFRGRNAQRDTAFADFLVGTGLRLTEGGSVLLPELPSPTSARPGTHNLKLHVASSIAKRQRARDVFLPLSTLARIEDYVLDRRFHAVTKRLQDGGYDTFDFDHVRQWSRVGFTTDERGRAKPYEKLKPQDRRRLVTAAGDISAPFQGPGVIWVSEDGSPMHPNSFDTIFRRARERCRKLGRDINITPHVLRHNFALGMLSSIMRAMMGARERNAFLELAIDPLGELARLMGHRSVETTRKYLTYLREADEIIIEAVDSWAARYTATLARNTGRD